VTGRLLVETYLGWVTKPRLAKALFGLHHAALKSGRRTGWKTGDHCLGAAIFMSPAFVHGLATNTALTNSDLKDCGLCDDHLYGLASPALGLTLADFAPDPLPLGLLGVGLPDTPENLIKRGKKIVHSVKPYHTAERNFFRKLRQADARKTAGK
jgi:hypothetical protein